MWQHTSVRSSSYDVDALVRALDEKSADGWEVVSIVPASGDIVAILRKGAGGGDSMSAGSAAAAMPPVEVPPSESVDPIVDTTVMPASEALAATEPVVEPVTEPAGWGAADSTPAAAAMGLAAAADPAPAAEVAPVDPAPVTPVVETTPVVAEPQRVDPIVAATAPTVPPQQIVTTPAGWYPDPSGRYEMRYWDGAQWTEHVARGGQQFTDPPIA